ncbi:MAG: hypothetical protein ACXABY_37640, partial [Candidatus Thorarchaeota archaeon]
MKSSLNIVTASDKNYFKYVPDFVSRCREVFPDAHMVLYDLGITLGQLGLTKSMDVTYCQWQPVRHRGSYPDGYIPRALHKPSMLFHAARHLRGPIIYMDVDAYPVSPFVIPDCDVAVTMKRKDQMAQYRGTELEEYLGKLDAGVIMFGPNEAREFFIAKWAMDMQDDPNPSDQKSLNRVVGECHDWEKYNITRNLDVAGDIVKIH